MSFCRWCGISRADADSFEAARFRGGTGFFDPIAIGMPFGSYLELNVCMYWPG